jgi:HlyD family secretion protein
MSRRTLLILGLTIILLALLYGFWPKPVPVNTGKVTSGPLRETVEDEGRTQVIDRYIVSSPVTGFALRVKLDSGDVVKKGDPITEIEPLRPDILDPRSRAEAEARVEAGDALLNASREKMQAAKAEADYAASELGRMEKLHESGLVSMDKLDRAVAISRQSTAILRSAQFEIDVALFEKEAALTALRFSSDEWPSGYSGKVIINSPINGMVLKVTHRSEGVVREGVPIIEIGDPNALEVVVDVLSADAVRITQGTPVFFHRWGGESPLEGRVRVVEPAGFTKISALGVEEQRVLVISDIISSQDIWGRLGDGYRVEASFVIWEGDVLQTPANSLFRVDGDWAVFVMEGGDAHRRMVKIDHRNGLMAEIVSGLSEGEEVITHPDSSIEDGTPVRLRD